MAGSGLGTAALDSFLSQPIGLHPEVAIGTGAAVDAFFARDAVAAAHSDESQEGYCALSGGFQPDNVDDDDASSVDSDDDPLIATYSYDKAFSTIEELSSHVAAFASTTHAFTLCKNGRTAKPGNLPTTWLKNMFRSHDPNVPVMHSGFLYCPHTLVDASESKQSCTWRIPYKLNGNGCWHVLETACVWDHNHAVSPDSLRVQSATGIIHLKVLDDVSVPHRAFVINYLGYGSSIKLLRRKFREKFPGYELRARVAKTIKTQYLRERYGCDRHQINELLQLLSKECGGMGGVCHIEHSQQLELERLYFQLPMLRAVGQFFGKFSIIDTTHNMTMYDRQLATFNVRRPLLHFWVYLISPQSRRLSTASDAFVTMLEYFQEQNARKFIQKASHCLVCLKAFLRSCQIAAQQA